VSDKPKPPPGRRQSRVPVTRTGRLFRMGLTAGGMAMGGLAEGLRRATGKAAGTATSALLSGANATRLAKRLAHMRGAAMKLGQLLSMESSHVLPPEFAEALAVLRASADIMPQTQVKRIMGRAYGKGWEQRFAEFEYEPAASASIGQVHRAVASDGRVMALKIQYPGVAKSIDSDVDNLAMFLNMARILPRELDVSDIIDEAKRQLRQEADYLTEATNLERYGALLADDERFVVPRVHRDFSTHRVLAMDWVEGEPLDQLIRDDVAQEIRDGIAVAIQDLTFRELYEFRFMQTDPNFANYLYRPRGRPHRAAGPGRGGGVSAGLRRSLPAHHAGDPRRRPRGRRAPRGGDRLPPRHRLRAPPGPGRRPHHDGLRAADHGRRL
jgi:predicted unusual protein kinase regulating ubiquinone biosynthesis (AarF/ABC1/UbiB family)